VQNICQVVAKSEDEGEPVVEIKDIEFDLSDIRKRKNSMWGIYIIYLFLLILIGVICAYFFLFDELNMSIWENIWEYVHVLF